MIEIREIAEKDWPEELRPTLIPGSRVLGAVDTTSDELIAVLGAFTAVILDPLWLTPRYRNHRAGWRALSELWSGARRFLQESGVRVALVVLNGDKLGMLRRVVNKYAGREITNSRVVLLPTGGR